MKFIQLLLPLALLAISSLKLSQGQYGNSNLTSTNYGSSTDTYSTPLQSYSSYASATGGAKRVSANIRYTAIRRIRNSGTGSGAGVAGRRGNRNANRSRNRRGNRNGNRKRNRRNGVNRNRQTAKGRRSNGRRRANNRRGAPVVRLG